MSFHLFRLVRLCAIALTGSGLASHPADADPYVSMWAEGSKSKVRLIAAPFDRRARFQSAGVDIELAPGTLTYWRSPGNAGVPPVFSFAGSTNLREIEVRYPAPTRIDEAGTDVFGYLGSVVLPLHVTPEDPERPVTLAMSLAYAVCDRVCLPVRASAELRLPAADEAAAGSDAQAVAIARAEAKVPRRLDAALRDAAIEIRAERQAATWRLAVRNGAARDLFAEAPEGWFLETSKAELPNQFSIAAAETPKRVLDASIPVTFTLVGEQESTEFVVRLDTAALRREDALQLK